MERTVSNNRALAIDGAAIAAVSVAICTLSQELVVMTCLVPAIFVARIVAWRTWVARAQGGIKAELLFLLLCTVLGGFNDWNSVVRHRVYDYTVPTFFPEISTIPGWMLLYWGLILRFIATLTSWSGLGATGEPRRTLRVGLRKRVTATWVIVAAELALVLGTRQAIYRLPLDPVFSWLPFLLALALHFALFGWDKSDLKLCALAALLGLAIEILYIQVGGLHRYHLGWLGGVPLWIVLWWVLAVLIWKDFALRVRASLHSRIEQPAFD